MMLKIHLGEVEVGVRSELVSLNGSRVIRG